MATNGDVGSVDRRDAPKIPVYVVAEEPGVRRRIASLLAADGVGVSARVYKIAAISALCAKSPECLVVMACQPGAAPPAIRALKRAGSETRIVVVANQDGTGRAVRAALRQQVEAVVYVDQLEEALVPTVRAVLAEQIVYPRRERRRVEIPALSHRERQVLRLAVDGRTNDEIASQLFLATSTVKSHLTSAFAKLAVCSRSEAAALVFNPDEPAGRAILAGQIDDPKTVFET